MRRTLLIFCCLLSVLTACAVVDKKGILVDVEPGTPMDESDLRQHCDLGDNAACVLAGLHDATAPDPRFPIVQGLAPADRAVFAALLPKGETVSWFVYDRELLRLTKLFTPKPVSRGDSKFSVQRLDVRGLLPGRTYELLAGDTDGHILDLRTFRPLDFDASALRFSLLGGWRFATPAERTRLRAVALARNPQLVIFAGSSVDATVPKELANASFKDATAFFFARHAAARAELALALERQLVPITALWNDDEFGEPDGNRAFTQRDRALEQLKVFFPDWEDEASLVDGPGISKTITFRSQILALVDDLSFRKPPAAGEPVCHKTGKREVCIPGKPVPAAPGTRYGTIQENWLHGRKAKADRPVWLLAGGPNLFPFHEGWPTDPALDSATLTHPARAPWVATVEAGHDGSLHLEEYQGSQKLP
jgi:hypothetical protein